MSATVARIFVTLFLFQTLSANASTLDGDRSLQMGGAYTALSDDASGLSYNPAGLAFVKHTSLSGSVNGYVFREITNKKVFGNEDMRYKITGVTSFFGVAKQLDQLIAPGYAGAFSISSPDNQVRDEDFKFSDPEKFKFQAGRSQVKSDTTNNI